MDQDGEPLFVESNVTSGDYLHGFFLGTRQALWENGRESITLTIRDISAFRIGVLIAMFERAVGYYASFVNVNAYHQPGVEAGKKAADSVLNLQHRVLECLSKEVGCRMTTAEIATSLNAENDIEHIFKVCEHLSANPSHRIEKVISDEPFGFKYSKR